MEEKLNRIEIKVDRLIDKWDDFFNPKDGAFTEVSKFQASCPRRFIKFIWPIIISIGIANVAAAASLMVMASKLINGG
jgi:hypothetical protein